jgi:hypothetical protein
VKGDSFQGRKLRMTGYSESQTGNSTEEGNFLQMLLDLNIK